MDDRDKMLDKIYHDIVNFVTSSYFVNETVEPFIKFISIFVVDFNDNTAGFIVENNGILNYNNFDN